MKNNKTTSGYLSTTQAAQRLGLSVGTIQRMVEAGVLQAYTTQGGHRRILSSSVNHYCQGTSAAGERPGPLCVLATQAAKASLRSLDQIAGLKLITQPLELASIGNRLDALFIDARIAWLPWEELQLVDSLGTEAHCIIYNSAHLPEPSRAGLQAQAHLYPGDISTDLIQGFLLGRSASARPSTTALTPQPGPQPCHPPTPASMT